MKKQYLLLILLLVIKIVMQYMIIHPVYDLHRDEFLHLDQAKHLAWGYLSVPPFTSWISWLIFKLGGTVFWVKFFPALFGALTLFIVWKTVEALKGNVFAAVLAVVAVEFSSIARLNILFQPNSFDVLCWACFYYTVIQYILSEKSKWLYYAAAVFAIGFLNKYNIVFCVIGILPAILLTGERKIFLNRHLYFAMLLALILISPNLIWQYNNGFPVVHHMAELSKTQLENSSRADFFKSQTLYFLATVYLLVMALIGFFIYRPFSRFRLFFWSFIFTLAVFAYFKAKGYYAMGIYPVYIAFGAVYFGKLTSGKLKFFLRPLSVALPVILFLLIVRVFFPSNGPGFIQQKAEKFEKLGLLKWEDGKNHSLPQDYADMLGWSEMARKTDSVYNFVHDGEHTLVLCENYGEAGAVNYYSKIKNIGAVAFNADYIHWFPLEKKIEKIIYIKERPVSQDSMTRERSLFNRITPFDSITNPFAREHGSVIYILSEPKTDINRFFREELERRKNDW